jgi:hypothetical protein
MPENQRDEWIATEFQRLSDLDDFSHGSAVLVRMCSPFYAGIKWAVRWMGRCVNKSGDMEFEPSPSSRDAEFYTNCRFDSLEEALSALEKYENLRGRCK